MIYFIQVFYQIRNFVSKFLLESKGNLIERNMLVILGINELANKKWVKISELTILNILKNQKAITHYSAPLTPISID